MSKRTINRRLAPKTRKPVKKVTTTTLPTVAKAAMPTDEHGSFIPVIETTPQEQKQSQRVLTQFFRSEEYRKGIDEGRAQARAEWQTERDGLLDQIASLKKQLAAIETPKAVTPEKRKPRNRVAAKPAAGVIGAADAGMSS